MGCGKGLTGLYTRLLRDYLTMNTAQTPDVLSVDVEVSEKHFCYTTFAPAADAILVMRADTNINVRHVKCIVEDATSVDLTAQECDSAGDNCGAIEAAITCDVDGASDDGIDAGGVEAGDWIRFDYANVVDAPDHITSCIV